MRIVFVSRYKLPVTKYGGTERFQYWLMKELVRRNFDVVLIGHPGSDLRGSGISLIPFVSDDWRKHLPTTFDLVHLSEPYNFDFDFPYLLTVGGNGKKDEVYPLNTVFVSKKHAENHKSSAYVYNGLDLSEYKYIKRGTEWDHFMFLAKASWKVKNLKDCVRVCKSNKKHLYVAGGRSRSFSRYIHSYGMVDSSVKNLIFSKSDALLFPVRWHEPFGIAVIEAMATGLPVIASPYGSLPELVNGNVGYICANYSMLYDVVGSDNKNFNSDEIRQYVEDNFSISVIADKYIEYYEKVIRNIVINEENPICILKKPAEDLLPF